MKVAIILLSLVGATLAHPLGGLLPAPVPYGYFQRTPAAFSYNVATGNPPLQYYTYGALPYATYYRHTPLVTGSTYHAQDTLGQYSYGYATSDGQAKAEAKTIDGRVVGRFSYIDPTGKLIDTTYTAGADGFKAYGDHLPKPVEVPELPEDVKAAYDKAKEEFEEAKNRTGPETSEATETSEPSETPKPEIVTPAPLAPSMIYMAAHPYMMPTAGKSAYAYVG